MLKFQQLGKTVWNEYYLKIGLTDYTYIFDIRPDNGEIPRHAAHKQITKVFLMNTYFC